MGVNDFVFALHIHGLRHPTDTSNGNPIVLSTGLLPGLGTILPALSSAVVLPYLRPSDVSGYNWSSDPRRIVGSGGQCVVKLDDKAGVWGTQFFKTPTSQTWSLEAAKITSSEATIKIKGRTNAPPLNNSIVWLESEALKVTAVTATTSGATLTISRGQCGSRARAHRVDPATYAGTDGISVRMLLDSRPDIANQIFTAQLFLFKLDQFGAVTSSYVSRYCYLESVPRPLKGRVWELRLRDVGDLLAQHEIGSVDRTVTLSHRIVARTFDLSVTDGSRGVPKEIYIDLTRTEAELFFREPLHVPGTSAINESFVVELGAKVAFFASPEVDYFIEIDAGQKWLYRLDQAVYRELSPSQQTQFRKKSFVEILASLVDREPVSGVWNDETQYVGDYHLIDGWDTNRGAQIGLQKPGEQAPKITLRPVLTTTPVKAFLALCCSDGNFGDDPYDLVVGRIGAGLPSSWFNLGTTTTPIATIDPGTTSLLRRNQLLTNAHYYPLQLSKKIKLGDFLTSDLCLPHALLMGPLLDGKLTLRPWARPAPVSPVTLPTTSDREIEPGTRLPKVSSLLLQAGFRALTLEPRYVRTVQGANIKKADETQPVRIWEPGEQLSLQSISSGSLSLLVAGFLDLYGGAPVVYEVPTSLDFIFSQVLQFLDFVYWSNVDVLSEIGSGVSGTFLVLGYSIEWQTGRVTARVIKDTYQDNDVTTTTINSPISAIRPPVFSVSGQAVQTATNRYTVPVKIVGAPSVKISNLSGNVGSFIVGSKVRIFAPKQIPDQALSSERDGYLEAYAEVQEILHDEGTNQNFIKIAVLADWNRGSSNYVGQQILTPKEGFIALPDERSEGASLESADIQPKEEQLYSNGAGGNFIKFAGSKPFDRARNEIKQA